MTTAHDNNLKPKYRALALDGGGIRGLITIKLLEELERQVPGWMSKIDLIAGTSTGGLIALGLASGLSLQELKQFYISQAAYIYQPSPFKGIDGLLWPRYQIKHFEEALKTQLGATRTLGELNPKPRVLIAVVDLDNMDSQTAPPKYARAMHKPSERQWKAKLFHNGPSYDSDADQLAYKVGLYTSVEPSYWPAVDGYIDGGLYAVNPSLCALAQSLDERGNNHPELEHIALLSLGTGNPLYYIRNARNCMRGYISWVVRKPRLFSAFLDSAADAISFQCQQILRNRYCRFAPHFAPGAEIAGDDISAKNFNAIDDFVTEVINSPDRQPAFQAVIKWLQTEWMPGIDWPVLAT